MKCKNIKKLLYDYTKNEVSASQKKTVAAHISECAGCEEELLRIKGIKTLFKAEMKNPPKGLLRSVKRKAGIETIWDRLFAPKPAIAFALTLMVVAFTGTFGYNNSVKDNEIREFYSDSFNIYETTAEENNELISFADIYENDNI